MTTMAMIWRNSYAIRHKLGLPTRSPVRLRNILVVGVVRVLDLVVSDLFAGAAELDAARATLQQAADKRGSHQCLVNR